MRPFLIVVGGLVVSLAIFAAGSFLARNAQLPTEQSGEVAGRENLSANSPRDLWRRTTRGWEQADSWDDAKPGLYRPRVHPLLIGGLQLLISAGVLVAFSETKPTTSNRTEANEFPRIFRGDLPPPRVG